MSHRRGNRSNNSTSRKNGDWDCSCGELNFASRNECRKCGKSKNQPINSQQLNPHQNPIIQSSNQRKPGDWTCACGELNFAIRIECRKCKSPKNQQSLINPLPQYNNNLQQSMNQNNVQPKYESNQEKPGDWTCACGELNFRVRDKCRKCGNMKPLQPSNNQQNEPSIQGKPGDWKCACGELNFAIRIECRNCKSPKNQQSLINPLLQYNNNNQQSMNQNIVQPINQENVNEEEEEPKCVVCLDKRPNMIIIKCGHLFLCEECAPSCTSCPMCRISFAKEEIIKVYQD